MKKIKIGGREFYVIPECKKKEHTLCIATEAWGSEQWADDYATVNILSVADNCNPDSLVFSWYEDLPKKVKNAMLELNINTGGYCDASETSQWYAKVMLDQVKTFVPSKEEWEAVPQEIRKKIPGECWSRSWLGKKRYNMDSAWYLNECGEVCSDSSKHSFNIVPAFYLSDKFLKKDTGSTWIITVSNSECDGPDLYKVEAPYGAVKRTIQKMMRETKESEGDAFDYTIPVAGSQLLMTKVTSL